MVTWPSVLITLAKPGLADPNRTLFIAYPRGAAGLSSAACRSDASLLRAPRYGGHAGKICDWESAIRSGEKRQEANSVGAYEKVTTGNQANVQWERGNA